MDPQRQPAAATATATAARKAKLLLPGLGFGFFLKTLPEQVRGILAQELADLDQFGHLHPAPSPLQE